MSRAHRSISKDPAKAFISTWDTSIVYTGSTANNQIKLPLISTGTYKFTVQWGDSTSNVITSWNQPEVTHTYAAPGVYTVTITGFIKGWDFAGQVTNPAAIVGDRKKIISITQWGCLRLVTFESTTIIAGAFYECSNLNLSGVTDLFNFKGTTSALGFLRRCTFATVPNINKWDVSKISYFRSMLREMPLFNQDIGYWNVSRGEDFTSMFSGFSSVAPHGSFNQQSIVNWDMSNAIEIGYMFFNQLNFDQEIGKWNITNKVKNITGIVGASVLPGGVFTNGGTNSINNWDVSNTTNMQSVFQLQPLFNCYIGDWNTSNVTNMFYMFGSSAPEGIFNQDISNWDVSKVTNMTSMLQNQPLFNQEIGKWDVSNVNSLEFLLTTNSPGAFTNADSSSINNWNLIKLVNFRGAFERSLSFNQPINNWNLPLVNNMSRFMYEIPSETYAFSVQNYSDFLINLANQPLQPNVQLQIWQFYDSSAVAARAILTSAPYNWTILDKGLQP